MQSDRSSRHRMLVVEILSSEASAVARVKVQDLHSGLRREFDNLEAFVHFVEKITDPGLK
ncbi:hypothetical protein HNR42_001984 [Deinobacterium chartae]|uniref:Uncharacterized protein n=1 Tax=Deinobacterium chartae TaxID=521158 RepID=A0A841I2B3_9DEIO|nr:hypothetical protein [Deinobacterium chartae]MBB6098550.1 hypothetical protein [Deinobacterium chartae]